MYVLPVFAVPAVLCMLYCTYVLARPLAETLAQGVYLNSFLCLLPSRRRDAVDARTPELLYVHQSQHVKLSCSLGKLMRRFVDWYRETFAWLRYGTT